MASSRTGTGPVVPLEDPRVILTMGGDAADLGWFAEDRPLDGTCVSFCIAGHDRAPVDVVRIAEIPHLEGETSA
ncbi:hypothetical protein ACFQ36_02505 [Arthrobacter sp. GCM10027362]